MRVPRRMVLLATGLLVVGSSAVADQLLDRMRSRLSTVKDYKCDVLLNARLPQMTISKMRMTLYYKRPNKVHVEAKEGFALLPEDGLYLGDPVEEALARFVFEPMGPADFGGRKCMKYALRPKRDVHAPLGSLRAYIDRSDALPVGFVGKTREGAQLSTVFTYTKVQNKHWLPAKTVLTATGLEGGPGRAEVTFGNYRINTGLPDALFRPKKSVGGAGK